MFFFKFYICMRLLEIPKFTVRQKICLSRSRRVEARGLAGLGGGSGGSSPPPPPSPPLPSAPHPHGAITLLKKYDEEKQKERKKGKKGKNSDLPMSHKKYAHLTVIK